MSEATSAPSQIDHIVLLLSPSDFDNVPSWLADNFTIIDGGTHSKGTSHNKLIIFEDGTYLELFSWIDPPPSNVAAYADFPGWADKPLGCIIDWAITGADAHGKFHDVTTQLKDLLSDGENLNIGYDQPVAGGRRRKDGQELRWVTTRPRRLNTADGNNDTDLGVPFFCHDISVREARVPYVKNSIDNWPGLVTHASGVVGIAGLTIMVPRTRIKAFVKLYEAILGVNAEASLNKAETIDSNTYKFFLSSPAQIRQLNLSSRPEDEQNQSQNESAFPDASCFVELRGVDGEQTGPSLRQLALRTSTADRRGKRIDGDQMKSSILLA